MKISIKSMANIIMLMQIIFILYSGLVVSYYPSFSIVSYIPDLLNVFLLFLLLIRIQNRMRMEYFLLLLFVLYVFLSVLWGDMNTYDIFLNGRRYISAFVVYFMASEYMTRRYWDKGVNILLISQGINVFATAYQNLVMELHPDFCNGIFGFESYYNAAQGMFCIVISVIAMVYFLDRKWPAWKMIYAIGSSCVICAFAEIKVYYVLLILMACVALFFRHDDQKMIKKGVKFIIIGAVLLVGAYKILEIVFPANLKIFTSISQYVLYEQYGARGGASRLTSISYIYNSVFQHNVGKILFGLGFGGAINDNAYTIGKIFLTSGAVGLSLLLTWLVYLLVKKFRTIKNSSEGLVSFITIIGIIVAMSAWNVLFTQVVFLIFWVLASANMEQHTP